MDKLVKAFQAVMCNESPVGLVKLQALVRHIWVGLRAFISKRSQVIPMLLDHKQNK